MCLCIHKYKHTSPIEWSNQLPIWSNTASATNYMQRSVNLLRCCVILLITNENIIIHSQCEPNFDCKVKYKLNAHFYREMKRNDQIFLTVGNFPCFFSSFPSFNVRIKHKIVLLATMLMQKNVLMEMRQQKIK